MKEIYLDIMEKALSAYTPERIREYITEVRENGLTEHGFPRLGANIGILMAHGRQLELKAVFIEIINLCVEGFAHPAGSVKAGNNFAVREVCFALMELEKTEVIVSTGKMIIKYNGSFCQYTFSGKATEYGTFFNRNGRYRVYKIFDDNLHIELGDMNE